MRRVALVGMCAGAGHVLALAVALAACGGGETRAEACTELFLQRVPEDERKAGRGYVERTYCEPFAERGWVREDGTLGIEAQVWFETSGAEECEPSPCPAAEPDPFIDCAILHRVGRSEVRKYLRGRDVECDDGTPLTQLGVP